MIWQYKFLIIPTFAWFTVQIFKFLSDSIKNRNRGLASIFCDHIWTL